MSALLELHRDDDAHVHQCLTDEPISWLASVTPDHRPHTVPVWFAWNDPTILTSARRRRSPPRTPRHVGEPGCGWHRRGA
ncbi:MAG TPA: pyridoxamine 5'-phosphate oxidase family protein, partial [Pseudonocardiaceae bacterium]|nr:pyridoxamine 5'-phosphate oxidase family protein [Pseudonocardiaceae bacterium]